MKTARRFILCPHCGAKSRKLRSDFGGLETRECRNRHQFEYDKWIAGRAFWGAAIGGKIPNPFGGK